MHGGWGAPATNAIFAAALSGSGFTTCAGDNVWAEKLTRKFGDVYPYEAVSSRPPIARRGLHMHEPRGEATQFRARMLKVDGAHGFAIARRAGCQRFGWLGQKEHRPNCQAVVQLKSERAP